MMSMAMGWGMTGMGLIGALVVVDLLLVGAAAIKYLFLDRGTRN